MKFSELIAVSFDQRDVETCMHALRIEAKALESKLKAAGQTVPACPQPATSDDTMSAYEAIEGHVARLRVQANMMTSRPQTPATTPATSAPTAPAAATPAPAPAQAAKPAPIRKLTATEKCQAAKSGVIPSAVEQKPQGDRKLTFTEKCQAAKAAQKIST